MRSTVRSFLCCLSLSLASCGKVPPAAPLEPPTAKVPATYLYVSPDEAEKLIASTPNLGILDVRDEPEMHANGLIAKARPRTCRATNSVM